MVNRTLSLLLGALAAASLVGCGGGGGAEPAPVAVAVVTQPTVLAATPATTAAVAEKPFAFPAGVAALGTTAPTTITFSAPPSSGTTPATSPAFTIASESYTAKGTTTFGSCIFKITESNFPAGHRMALGNTITVNPCNIKVETAGLSVNAPAEERSVALLLGTAASSGTQVVVDVNPGGQLTVGGLAAGTVTIEFVTGS